MIFCRYFSHVNVVSLYFADLGDELFLFSEVDLPRCCFGDLEEAVRLRLLDAGAAAFFALETVADDFAADDLAVAAGEDLAAGERVLPRVTRFSAEDGVFGADRLELRGILLAISAIYTKLYLKQHTHFCQLSSWKCWEKYHLSVINNNV